MPRTDPRAAAINAAGIADAFRLAQINDHDGDNRAVGLADHCGGWVGVVEQIAEAGAAMEHIRVETGPGAKWGGELPYIYDAWDAIGQALWREIDSGDVERVVREALQSIAADEADA